MSKMACCCRRRLRCCCYCGDGGATNACNSGGGDFVIYFHERHDGHKCPASHTTQIEEYIIPLEPCANIFGHALY